MIAEQTEVASTKRLPLAATVANSWWAAVQFLTRIPTPAITWSEATLPRALVFFPIVGLALGYAAGGLELLLAPHLQPALAALLVVGFLVAITGALHEDGLADCADAFGSRHSITRTLAILKDSRIGTYGAIALITSIAARILLIAALPNTRVIPYLIAAETLSRWTVLPLSLLPSATPGTGSGNTIAQRTPKFVLITGTIIMVIILAACLHLSAIVPALFASVIVLASAAFFRSRIGGTTGDCFGAVIQLVQIAVLLCGVWK